MTPNLGLPELIAAQAQKHVTVNEALRALDTLVHLAVLDRDLAAPPASPAEGQRWLVAADPTGDWTGHPDEIATWQDSGWDFYAPQIGWLAYVVDEGALLAWTGSAWIDAIGTLTSLNNMNLLGVGTIADAANPFSAKLNNILWVARTLAEGGDGDLRWKMNKETAADTLSMLFQTAYSGRAELGLTGDDDFRIKVSADGSNWRDAIIIDRATGGVRFKPSYSLVIVDDAVATIPLPPGAQAMFVMLTSNSSGAARPNGLLFARCTTTPQCVNIVADPASTGVDITTGLLTGTTGTDGNFTMSAHTDGKLYLENRTGGSRAVGASILSSI